MIKKQISLWYVVLAMMALATVHGANLIGLIYHIVYICREPELSVFVMDPARQTVNLAEIWLEYCDVLYFTQCNKISGNAICQLYASDVRRSELRLFRTPVRAGEVRFERIHWNHNLLALYFTVSRRK